MKHRKCKKTQKAKTNREYKVAFKTDSAYCIICNKRAGMFHAYCGPYNIKVNRNWKSYRKHQWK